METMRTMRLALNEEWAVGARIGDGGFGAVFEAENTAGEKAAVKLVPKTPGTEREMLFTDLDGIHNVVPVIDSGEHEDQWVLVMPRAEKSLRDHLQEHGQLPLNEAVAVLSDVAEALADLKDREVVHRDLKPENILLLGGRWCLADFGIARYAEATTAQHTYKGGEACRTWHPRSGSTSGPPARPTSTPWASWPTSSWRAPGPSPDRPSTTTRSSTCTEPRHRSLRLRPSWPR